VGWRGGFAPLSGFITVNYYVYLCYREERDSSSTVGIGLRHPTLPQDPVARHSLVAQSRNVNNQRTGTEMKMEIFCELFPLNCCRWTVATVAPSPAEWSPGSWKKRFERTERRGRMKARWRVLYYQPIMPCRRRSCRTWVRGLVKMSARLEAVGTFTIWRAPDWR